MDAGDTVIITDTIAGITYDEKNDRSIFEFDTDQGTAYWPFDGDLLDQFSAGDPVTFEFSVVNKYAAGEFTFETVDYFKNAEYKLIVTGVSLDIDDYLVCG